VADELTLAAELDRALAGEPAGSEARELASLLVAASNPARFEVADAEVEQALARTERPRTRARRRPRLLPGLALAGAAAAAALVAWQLRTPGVDVQAKAARAVDATFFVVQEVRPARPGTFPPTTISGYVDGRDGRVHARISSSSGLNAETVVQANGTVERWLSSSNTVTVAPSCRVLEAACADLLDPFSLYVRAVESPDVTTRHAGSTYRVTLRRGRVEETAVVDGATFLPRRIEWRQDGRLYSTTRFAALERQTSPVSAEAWDLSPHPGARVVQLTDRGKRVRILAVRPARLRRGELWLGPSYDGHKARVDAVELTGGTATRISYGPVVVWDYREVAPPAVAQNRTLPAKVFAIPGGGIVHAYFGESETVVAEASFGDQNAAVVSVGGEKDVAVRAVQQLRRRGPP
jgi:hypothetical protein